MAKKAPVKSNKHWTKEDIDYLLSTYGDIKMETLAKKLGRSVVSIRRKHYDMTGTYDEDYVQDTYSAAEVADVLGISSRTVCTWARNLDFPAKKVMPNGDKETMAKNFNYHINPEKMWKWLNKNRDRINFAYVQRGVLLPEPTWLDEAITHSRKNDVKTSVRWTKEEDDTAFSMWWNGFHHEQISKFLNRSNSGTRNRLTYLRKLHGKERKKNDNKEAWQWV